MLDVPELEKRWSKYHFKKMLPKYIGSAVFISLLAAISGYFYMSTDLSNTKRAKTAVAPAKKVSATHKVTENRAVTPKQEPIASATQVDIPQNVLHPSLAFTAVIRGEILRAQLEQQEREQLAQQALDEQKARELALKKKRAAQRKKEAQKRRKAKALAEKKSAAKKVAAAKASTPKEKVAKVVVLDTSNAVVKQEPDEVKVGHIQTSEDELKGVIKRFNRKKKPALSLFIANKYYEKGDYSQSYKYAKETLKLNPKIEDAVILYAKSLVKLGKKDKAVKKLNSYYKKSRSIKAKALLTEINKGTFK